MVESNITNQAPLSEITETKQALALRPEIPIILIFGGMGTGKSTFVSNLTGIEGKSSDQIHSVTRKITLHSTEKIHALDVPGVEDSF